MQRAPPSTYQPLTGSTAAEVHSSSPSRPSPNSLAPSKTALHMLLTPGHLVLLRFSHCYQICQSCAVSPKYWFKKKKPLSCSTQAATSRQGTYLPTYRHQGPSDSNQAQDPSLMHYPQQQLHLSTEARLLVKHHAAIAPALLHLEGK
jgi:hypothetical protein